MFKCSFAVEFNNSYLQIAVARHSKFISQSMYSIRIYLYRFLSGRT